MNSLKKQQINEEIQQLQQIPKKIFPLPIKITWLIYILTIVLRLQALFIISWWWFGGIGYLLFMGTFLYMLANRPGARSTENANN